SASGPDAAAASGQLVAVEDVDLGFCYLCCDTITDEAEKLVVQEGSDTRRKIACHKKCNSLKKRVQTVRNNVSGFECFCEVEGDQRAEFYKTAVGLYGPDLQKVMTETLETKRVDSNVADFIEEGDFMEVNEARELPRFKRDPAAFQNLLERAPRKTCAMTDIEYVYVPNYKFSNHRKVTDESTRARRISGAKTMKKPKALAAPKGPKEPAAPKGSNIPKGILNRSDKLEERMGQCILDTAESIMVAKSPEADGHVSARALEQAVASHSKLEQALQEFKEVRTTEGLTKETLVLKIEHTEALMNSHIDIQSKLDGMLEDVAEPILAAQAEKDAAGASGPSGSAAGDSAALDRGGSGMASSGLESPQAFVSRESAASAGVAPFAGSESLQEIFDAENFVGEPESDAHDSEGDALSADTLRLGSAQVPAAAGAADGADGKAAGRGKRKAVGAATTARPKASGKQKGKGRGKGKAKAKAKGIKAKA
ncbi:unnamed protein product, partial [Prorocentrum cordatum]